MSIPSQAIETPTHSEQKDIKDQNLEKMRKAYEQEKVEKAKLIERVTLLEKAQSQRSYSAPDHEDDDFGDEPYVDRKALSKVLKKDREQLKSELKEEARQEIYRSLEVEKQQAYVKQNPDFQNVLTAENIEQFAQNHPSIAERMLRMPDNFDRQALLYEQIKALQSADKRVSEAKSSIQDTINQNRRGPSYQPTGIGTAPYASTGDFSSSGQKNAYSKMQELKNRLRLG